MSESNDNDDKMLVTKHYYKEATEVTRLLQSGELIDPHEVSAELFASAICNIDRVCSRCDVTVKSREFHLHKIKRKSIKRNLGNQGLQRSQYNFMNEPNY